MATTERSAKTKTAFKLFDKNKDGFITRQEFLKVCFFCRKIYKALIVIHIYQVSKKLDAEQVEAVFARFDLNGDGRLSMDEFKLLMEKR